MRLVIQRVSEASVAVEGQTIARIGKGFLVLIGIGKDDGKTEADRLIKKMLGLRIFEDSDGKTNLSLEDVGGSLLLVSQFTLCADCSKGNRPSFINAMEPAEARRLYEYMIEECRKKNPHVCCGEFGADMKVSLCNDGPFTILLQ